MEENKRDVFLDIVYKSVQAFEKNVNYQMIYLCVFRPPCKLVNSVRV